MPRLRPVFLIIVPFVALLAVVLAQQGPPQPAATPPDTVPSSVVRVQTRLVVIDVIAQDKKGNPITDLGRPDFRLLEDGVEQKISIFSFQQPATTPEAVATTATHEAPLPPNHFRNSPHFKANSALNVILLDALNTTVLNQAYARDEMIRFLRTLPPGQPVAIYGLGRKLRLLQDFTTDTEALKKVIASFKGERSHVHSNAGGTTEAPLTLSGWAEQLLVEKAPLFKAQMEGFAQEDASAQMDFRVQYTVAALSSLAHMLAGYPGRKNLIWVTEAVPITVFGDYGANEQHENDSVRRSGNTGPTGISNARAFRNYEDALARIVNLFADAQVAVYPIDARGLVGSPFYNVANNISGQAAMGGLAIHSEGRLSEELFQAHTNMLDIAEKTGGRAFYNRNNLESALRSDIEDGSTYYTLAYYPSNKNWDGRFRKVQVNSVRSGVKLRYRIGYYAVDQAAYNKNHPELRDIDFANALDPNSPVSTALQFEAWVTPPSAESGDKVLVRYAIDPRRLALDVGADGLHHGEVDCAVRVFSPKDVEHPVLTDATRMEAAVKTDVFERINRSWFPCQVKLDLKPGSYLLRLAVRDNVTGLLGSLNASVTVPEAGTQK